MIVQTPAENLMLRVDIERVMIACEYVDGIAGADLLNHERLLILVTGIKEAAQLARLGISPSEDLAIGGHRQGVMCPTCHFANLDLITLIEQTLADSGRRAHSIVEFSRHGILKAP
jgi:hypothetical protein